MELTTNGPGPPVPVHEPPTIPPRASSPPWWAPSNGRRRGWAGIAEHVGTAWYAEQVGDLDAE